MSQAFRSKRVLTPTGLQPAVILVAGAKIASVRAWDEPSERIIDFGGAIVLPGLVDTHVHINEPGRAEWEGFNTATRAAAAGGVTTLVDMPLNCMPETTSVHALEAKRSSAQGKAWVDWATWGGVVRGNAAHVKPLIAAGVPGFKCFLIDSGIEGFSWVDEAALRCGFAELQGSGLPLLAHAEAPAPVEAATRALLAADADWRRYATFLQSRPDEAEIEAIRLLIQLAEEYGVRVHIVHLASAQAVPMLAAARARGVAVTVETCAHYLWFCSEEIPDDAPQFKCTPPIRNAANREALFRALLDGHIDMVTTDHSPCLPRMKRPEPQTAWNRAWGGIASLGLALPVLWTAMTQRGLATAAGVERLGEWLSLAPARLAGIESHKGAIRPGADADFAVFDPDAEWAVGAGDLHFRHPASPYLGAQLRGRVLQTWLRGERVFDGTSFEKEPRGREWTRA